MKTICTKNLLKSLLKNLPKQELTNLDFTLKLREGILLFLTGDFGVDIHSRFAVRVSHNVLNDFDVHVVFTQAGAESVPQMVRRKLRKQKRLSPFLYRKFAFLCVVALYYAEYGVIYAVRLDYASIIPNENETAVPVYGYITEPGLHLLCHFVFEDFTHGSEHRDLSLARFCFRG